MASIVLAGTTPRPPNRRIDKTARSTVRSVPFTTVDQATERLAAFRSSGALILALELTDASSSLLTYQLPKEVISGNREVILIPGSEVGGVPADVLALCHDSVHLPMSGQNTSMNVAVAAGAAVYLLIAQLSQ